MKDGAANGGLFELVLNGGRRCFNVDIRDGAGLSEKIIRNLIRCFFLLCVGGHLVLSNDFVCLMSVCREEIGTFKAALRNF